MTGVDLNFQDFSFWNTLTSMNWMSEYGVVTIFIALLGLFALVSIGLSTDTPAVAVGVGLGLVIIIVFALNFVLSSSHNRNEAVDAVTTLEEEYNVEFMDRIFIRSVLSEEHPNVQDARFTDNAFAVYEGYLIRIDENTIALTVPAGTEGTELVEWDSSLSLDVQLEEVEN